MRTKKIVPNKSFAFPILFIIFENVVKFKISRNSIMTNFLLMFGDNMANLALANVSLNRNAKHFVSPLQAKWCSP